MGSSGKQRWVSFTERLSLGFFLLAFAAGLGFFGEVPILKVVGTVALGIVAGGVSLWLGKGGDTRDD